MAYGIGSALAMEKFAFGPEDAAKLMRAVQKHISPNPPIRTPKDLLAPTPRAYPSAKQHHRNMSDQMVGPLTERGVPEEKARRFVRDMTSSSSGAPQDRAGLVLPDVSTWHPDAASFSERARKHLNALTAGHEQAEMASYVPGRTSAVFQRSGHNSPEVMFKEHNMLVTSPEDIRAELLPWYRQMRGPSGANEAAVLKSVGVTYGEGPRISRHARKRLTELLDAAEAPFLSREMDEMAQGLRPIPARPARTPAQLEAEKASLAAFEKSFQSQQRQQRMKSYRPLAALGGAGALAGGAYGASRLHEEYA